MLNWGSELVLLVIKVACKCASLHPGSGHESKWGSGSWERTRPNLGGLLTSLVRWDRIWRLSFTLEVRVGEGSFQGRGLLFPGKKQCWAKKRAYQCAQVLWVSQRKSATGPTLRTWLMTSRSWTPVFKEQLPLVSSFPRELSILILRLFKVWHLKFWPWFNMKGELTGCKDETEKKWKHVTKNTWNKLKAPLTFNQHFQTEAIFIFLFTSMIYYGYFSPWLKRMG